MLSCHRRYPLIASATATEQLLSRPVPERTVAVLRLWLPLAISFELMMLEGPAFQGAIGRLPDVARNLAAWGLAMAISLLIESPVIMLLGTSIALVHDGASFRALRRFVVWLCGLCTLATGLVAFTPVFDLVARGAMGQPPDIVAAARPAMRIMLFWTAAIGWRRFLQGVLVRHGHTRMVSYGTAIRLAFAVGTAVGLARWGRLTGVEVAAVAVMAAVLSEAAATTLFARTVLRDQVMPARREHAKPLTQRAILRFHTPLAATTLLTFAAQPLTSAALARLPNPEATLAAWPVAFMILLVIRGGCLAYQEITVAQARRPEARTALRRFAWALGLLCTAVAALVAFTPLMELYLARVIDLPPGLRGLARVGVAAGLLLPLVTTLGSWVRGILVAAGRTPEVYRGMLVNLGAHAGLLTAGVLLRVPGMWLAAIAFTLAALAEYAYLLRRTWVCASS